jgi:hypothetical protein
LIATHFVYPRGAWLARNDFLVLARWQFSGPCWRSVLKRAKRRK